MMCGGGLGLLMTDQQHATSDAPVTVLFTDVESSTALHARVGDSEARRILEDYDALVQRELDRHGGTSVKSLGDGVLATFASPRHAVASAVAIQRAVHELTRARPEHALGVRVGINTGEVIVSDRDVHGAAVNAAARIVAEANAGQVVVSDVVRQLLGPNPDVLVREWRHVTLKGLPGRWLLHEVVWQADGTVAVPDLSPSPETALVGREDVLTLLEHVLEQALDGQSQLALICGDPGIGKTAVARAVGALARRRGARVVTSATWEGGGAYPFWPWTQVITACNDERGGQPLDELHPALRTEVTRLLQEAGGAEPQTAEDAEHSRLRLFEAVARVLQTVAAKEPLVVVLDDLHWADDASLLLLSFLSRRVVGCPLLLLGTTRDPDDEADKTAARLLHDLQRHGTVVALAGLAPDETALLVTRVLGGDPGADVAQRLHDRTGGNPFFIHELARLAGAHGARASLPEGVRDVVERRLARLPQPCADLLGAAAVVGRHFDLGLLSTTTGRSAVELLEPLDAAVRARVLDDPPGPLGPYRFAHDLFRETLYEGLGTSRRAELHLAVAEGLSAESDSLPGRVADVAHHLSLALPLADAARTAEACRSAAMTAVARLGYEDAAGWYERALSARRLAAGTSTADDCIDLLLGLADAQRRAGQRAEAARTYQRILDVARGAERADIVAEATLGLDAMAIPSYVEDRAHRALLEEALGAVGAADSAARARLLASLARLELHGGMRWGDPHVLELSNEALAVAKRLGDPAIQAFCLLAHHDAMWHPSTARDRVAVATEMVDAATAAGDTERLFEARMLRLAALLELAEPEAELELEQMVALASDAHQPRLSYYALTRRAMWASVRGDLDAAERLTKEGKRLGDAIGEPDAERVWLAQRIGLQSDRGDAWALQGWSLPPAWRTSTSARGVMRAALVKWVEGDRQAAADILSTLGDDLAATLVGPLVGLSGFMLADVFVALGLADSCRRLYALLADHAGLCMVAAGAVSFHGSFDHHLGLLATGFGDRRAAVAHFEAALTLHQRLGARAWVARSRIALGELLVESDPERAVALLEEGRRTAETVGMRWLADQAVAARDRAAQDTVVPVFSRRGSVWTVAFQGDTVHLQHTKGLQDIARLVGCRGEDVHVAELMGLAESGADEVLDEQAKRAYRDRLVELAAEIDDAEAAHDLERAAKASEERATLLDELESALGLGGRNRRLGDPVERARKAVGGRVHGAIARISQLHEPLGRHLAASVRTGTYCSYRPRP